MQATTGMLWGLVLVVGAAVGGCASDDAAQAAPPQYDGVETRLLEGDLVQFQVTMRGGDAEAVQDYARCAAAQYALIRGYGFARHLRTNLGKEGGVWRADAVYTISPELPDGVRTIDAQDAVAECVKQDIPTV